MPAGKTGLPKTARQKGQRKSKYNPGLSSKQREELGLVMFFESKAGQEYLAQRAKDKAAKEAKEVWKKESQKHLSALKAKLIAKRKKQPVDHAAAKEASLRFLKRFAERQRGSPGARYDIHWVKRMMNEYPQVIREIRAERPDLFREIVKEFELKRMKRKGKTN